MTRTYSAKESAPKPEDSEFPMQVGHKSTVVSIYQTPNRGQTCYTIACHSGSLRRREMRRDFACAFALAQEVALRVGDGALNVLTLGGKERFGREVGRVVTVCGFRVDASATEVDDPAKE